MRADQKTSEIGEMYLQKIAFPLFSPLLLYIISLKNVYIFLYVR